MWFVTFKLCFVFELFHFNNVPVFWLTLYHFVRMLSRILCLCNNVIQIGNKQVAWLFLKRAKHNVNVLTSSCEIKCCAVTSRLFHCVCQKLRSSLLKYRLEVLFSAYFIKFKVIAVKVLLSYLKSNRLSIFV